MEYMVLRFESQFGLQIHSSLFILKNAHAKQVGFTYPGTSFSSSELRSDVSSALDPPCS